MKTTSNLPTKPVTNWRPLPPLPAFVPQSQLKPKPPVSVNPVIPAPWVQIYSKTQGKYYYYNRLTNETNWKFPKSTPPKQHLKSRPITLAPHWEPRSKVRKNTLKMASEPITWQTATIHSLTLRG